MEIIDLGNGATCEIDAYGNKVYILNNMYHRIGGPAIEHVGGYKAWMLFGKIHRIGGPAIERVYSQEWWQNGNQHRLDGPAIEFKYGDDYPSWYINGVEYSEKEFNMIKEVLWAI